MEEEKYVFCPYDQNHKVRYSRLPYHLVNCKAANNALAKTLVVCPYNARHRMPKKDLMKHMSSCESNTEAAALGVPFYCTTPANCVSLPLQDFPPSDENWEDELDVEGASAPFVLNGFENKAPYSKQEEVLNAQEPSMQRKFTQYAVCPSKESARSTGSNANPQAKWPYRVGRTGQNKEHENPWMSEQRQQMASGERNDSYLEQNWPRLKR